MASQQLRSPRVAITEVGRPPENNSPNPAQEMSGSNLEILAYESTPLGTLCLRRRELLSQPGTIVTEVTLNHEFLMSSLYTDSEEALSRIGIGMHGESGLKVMIGGLGLGYTAREALKSNCVASVEVVELLPHVIDWLKQGLVPLSQELIPQLSDTDDKDSTADNFGEPGDLNSNLRLKITQGDVYRRLAGPAQQLFDLILIDVDHSPDDRLDSESISFYREEGLRSAKKHLAPDGVIGIWSYAESSPFSAALHAIFDEVRVEPITHENRLIDEEHTDWLFFARG